MREIYNIQQSSMMLLHTDDETLKSHLRPLSVLVFHLLLTHSCRGQSRLIGSSQPIVATLGDDIILPCRLEPAVDVVARVLEWMKIDHNPLSVHLWVDGQDLVDIKHPSYEGRTSLFTDELKQGNISLKLSDVRLSDAGRYRCFIPKLNMASFIELVVGAVSSPVIRLAGTDKDKQELMLQCESAGWYPEPEVLWLDGEGNLLSAGPTETVRGPDDLYTVSSRVTVEKRHSNSFTCRVQQNNIHQSTETHIYILDDFFQVQSTYSSITTGLAVGLAVCVLLILLLLFVLWKWRQNIVKTKRNHRNKTNKGRRKNRFETNRKVDHLVTEEEMIALKGKGQNKSKHDHNLTSPAYQDSAESHITVDEVDVYGKYVHLSNKSEEDQPMGDWELHIRVNNRKPIKYQFKPSFILKAGKTVTIWASDCGIKRETSTDLVWFGQKSWGTGETLLITIYSNTGELEERKMLALQSSQSNLQEQQDSAMRNVTVSDLKGSYVRLSNTSKKDQPLEGWEIHIEVNDRKPIVYKFLSSLMVTAGNTVTIWSSDHSDRNNPPTDLVWFSQKSWGTEKELLVTVYNNTGEEIARELKTPNTAAV